MAGAEVVSEPLLVAAIDFGITFSGYAFQTRADFKEDPLRIHGFGWWYTGFNTGLSLKTPTCVLFNPSQEFHSFGMEAEDKYTELAQQDDHRNWHFFRRFKMNLYRSADIPRDLMLEDDQGKHLPAIKVISESINYLREHMMKELSKKGDLIKPNEINWVLTIPAIWSDAAKQFMREAAVKGGIPNSQLMLALEPEAASIYCKHIPSERMVVGGKSSQDAFSPGTKYLILDAGGTIDITVQEVQYDGTIKQLYIANGGNWGGTKVDQAFEEFLLELVGAQTLYRFRDEDKSGHLDLAREFEIRKRIINPNQTSKVAFRIPLFLKEAYEDFCDLKESISQSSKRITWVGYKIRMEPDSARELFKSTCDYITHFLELVFSVPKVKGANTILMVGGFSDSPMLRDAVEKAFPDKTIIMPPDAGLAVLRGAVLFGFTPNIHLRQTPEQVRKFIEPNQYSLDRRNQQHNELEIMQMQNDIQICKKEKAQLEKALTDMKMVNLELANKLRLHQAEGNLQKHLKAENESLKQALATAKTDLKHLSEMYFSAYTCLEI